MPTEKPSPSRGCTCSRTWALAVLALPSLKAYIPKRVRGLPCPSGRSSSRTRRAACGTSFRGSRRCELRRVHGETDARLALLRAHERRHRPTFETARAAARFFFFGVGFLRGLAVERQFVLPRRTTGSYHLTRQRTSSSASRTPPATCARHVRLQLRCRAGRRRRMEAWAPPKAKAMSTDDRMPKLVFLR